MLIVHPNSSCDVCLEHYGTGSKSPHSISCGHVFCLGCLESIATGICPLCRDRFHPPHTRKLHIDIDVQGAAPPLNSTSVESSAEARRLQDSIAKIVKDGSSESHLRALIEECNTFLKTQHRTHHEDLRVSFRMISYLCEVKSNLKKRSESLATLEVDHDALRTQLTAELEAAERKYEDLLQTSTDEKETALAVEKSMREHYKQVLMRCETAEAECERLSQELDRLRPESLTAQLCPMQDRTRHKVDDVPFPTQGNTLDSKGTMIRNPDKEALYLSPLPESIDHLPSSLKSFIALPEVDYDFEKTKDIDSLKRNQHVLSPVHESISPVNEPSHLISDHPRHVRSLTEFTTTNLHAPRISSGLSLTAPHDSEMFDEDVQRSRHSSSSRSSRHSSPSPFKPTPGAQHPISIRESYSRDRGRSLVLGPNEPEQLRSQLHDLLNSPVSSSLPNMSHFPSRNALKGPSPPSPSRSSSSVSQRPLHALTHGNTYSPMTTSTHAVPPPQNSHLSVTMQRPMISHASSVAWAEKEKQKAEKERREAAENERQKVERRQLSAVASSNSLREHSNVYPSPVQSSTTRRDATNIYGPSTGTVWDAKAHSMSRGSSSSLRDAQSVYGSHLHRQQGLGNGRGRLPSAQTVFT